MRHTGPEVRPGHLAGTAASALLLLLSGCGDSTTSPAGTQMSRTLPLVASWGRSLAALPRDSGNIAVAADGTIYLLDGGRILRFTPLGQRLPDLRLTSPPVDPGGGEFVPAGRRADFFMGQDDRLYLIESPESDGVLVRLNRDGSESGRLKIFGAGAAELDPNSALAVDARGTIIGVDPWARQVRRFDSDGLFLGAFGSRCADPGGFEAPGAPILLSDGSIVVLDTQLQRGQRFTAGGELIEIFLTTADDRVRIPGLGSYRGQDAGDVLYFHGSVTASRQLFERYEPGVGWLPPIEIENRTPIRSLALHLAVILPDGGILIPDFRTGTVARHTPDGAFAGEIGEPTGPADTQFLDLECALGTRDGDILLCMEGNPERIRRFSREGRLLTFWEAPSGGDLILPASDGEGRIVALDRGREWIVELRSDGVVSDLFPVGYDPESGHSLSLSALEAGPSGEFLGLSNGQLVRFGPDRRVRLVGSLEGARSLSAGSPGTYWVLTRRHIPGTSGLDFLSEVRLRGIDAAGTVIAEVDLTIPWTGFSPADMPISRFAESITADPWGGVWAAGLPGGELLYFDSRGGLRARAHLAVEPGGQPPTISNIDAGIPGRLLVLDRNRGRIHLFDTSGVR